MQIYHVSLEAIERRCKALFHEDCNHCKKCGQLISHGFVFKKQSGSESAQPVGKRVFCSNRNGRTGCGQTMQLYLDSTIRYLHYAGSCLVAFILKLVMGGTVQQAYEHATGTAEPRNASRWLNKFFAQLSAYRSAEHQPSLQHVESAGHPPHWGLLTSTFTRLLQQFGQPLCACYQRDRQRSFV